MDKKDSEDYSGEQQFDEFEIDIVPENGVNLFNLLLSSNLTHYLKRFLDEDFDDEVLFFLDPQSTAFWNTISKILPTVGTQLKFQNALKLYQESKGLQKEVGSSSAEVLKPSEPKPRDETLKETKNEYSSFNEFEVSS